MKLAILSCLLASVAAFAPGSPANARSPTVVLKEADVAVEEVAEVAEEPAPVAEVVLKPKVPLGGGGHMWGQSDFFFGERVWDTLTMDWGSEQTGKFIRAAEIKHGRSAMLATVGFAFHKSGLTLDKISIHEYLSVTQGIKFADLAAMTPPEAMKMVPAAGITQMFAFIAAFEIYEMTHTPDELVRDSRVAPGLMAGGLTGDIGWNPLDVEITDRRRKAELQNGRAAMVAISIWISHDAIQGSVPFPPLPWN
mmetsp:Transcript_50758/g.99221  ORF Transcript_50758/g.99221 Transcript_50758/m.99221 type:complete len:252 (+) Transcript_50758:115-870(+)